MRKAWEGTAKNSEGDSYDDDDDGGDRAMSQSVRVSIRFLSATMKRTVLLMLVMRKELVVVVVMVVMVWLSALFICVMFVLSFEDELNTTPLRPTF